MLKDSFSSATVERVGSKVEMVGISNVALDGQALSTLARLVDHGFAVIHADNPAGRGYEFGQAAQVIAGPASHLENGVTGPYVHQGKRVPLHRSDRIDARDRVQVGHEPGRVDTAVHLIPFEIGRSAHTANLPAISVRARHLPGKRVEEPFPDARLRRQA
jgi:hypothetical protein